MVCLAASLGLVLSVGARAEGTDALASAINKFPQKVLANPEPVQVAFIDMQMLQRYGKEINSPHGVAHNRIQAGVFIDAFDTLAGAGVSLWEKYAGVSLQNVQYFAAMGQSPHAVNVWGLSQKENVSKLIDSLSDQGFESVGMFSGGVIGNGKPLELDFSKIVAGSPWRSVSGYPTFVAQKEDALIQSSTPQAVKFMKDGGKSVGDSPVVATALKGVEEAGQSGPVIQAVLISPVFGAPVGDPSKLVLSGSTDTEKVRAELASLLKAAGQGVPLYLGGLIADVQAEHPTLVMSLAYPDCGTAETAVSAMKQRWTASMAASVPGALVGHTFEGADGLCAATLSVVTDEPTVGVNPAFKVVMADIMQRRFDVLQIAAAQ